jgi:hypothetical protein
MTQITLMGPKIAPAYKALLTESPLEIFLLCQSCKGCILYWDKNNARAAF